MPKLTTGEIAKLTNCPVWEVRRVVDSISGDVERAGQYRLVPHDLLPEIIDRLNAKPKRREAVA